MIDCFIWVNCFIHSSKLRTVLNNKSLNDERIEQDSRQVVIHRLFLQLRSFNNKMIFPNIFQTFTFHSEMNLCWTKSEVLLETFTLHSWTLHDIDPTLGNPKLHNQYTTNNYHYVDPPVDMMKPHAGFLQHRVIMMIMLMLIIIILKLQISLTYSVLTI